MAASNKCTVSAGSFARSRNEYRLSLPDASPLKELPIVLRKAAYFGVPPASFPTKTALWYFLPSKIMPNLLQEIYDEWLGRDYSHMDDLRQTIADFKDYMVKTEKILSGKER